MRSSQDMDRFVALHLSMAQCTDCPLHESRTQVVPGDGPWDAEVMLIGEAPGASEDALGKPFVGASGKLLDPLLSSNCIGRENIYVTNVVKCRPPGNRQPTHEEMVTCYKYLAAQIKFINPRVIILCGATALKLFNRRGKITEDHGVPFTCEGKVCLPTYHAAAALRTRSLVFDIANDLKKVKEILKNGTPDGIRDFSVVKAYQRKLYRER